jgi:hypothetical protein
MEKRNPLHQAISVRKTVNGAIRCRAKLPSRPRSGRRAIQITTELGVN